MGYRHLKTLIDFARADYWAQIKCPCGHTRRVDPMKLLELAVRRELPTHPAKLAKHLLCRKCGEKHATIEYCNGPERWSR
jgi:hypothetical protein